MLEKKANNSKSAEDEDEKTFFSHFDTKAKLVLIFGVGFMMGIFAIFGLYFHEFDSSSTLRPEMIKTEDKRDVVAVAVQDLKPKQHLQSTGFVKPENVPLLGNGTYKRPSYPWLNNSSFLWKPFSKSTLNNTSAGAFKPSMGAPNGAPGSLRGPSGPIPPMPVPGAQVPPPRFIPGAGNLSPPTPNRPTNAIPSGASVNAKPPLPPLPLAAQKSPIVNKADGSSNVVSSPVKGTPITRVDPSKPSAIAAPSSSTSSAQQRAPIAPIASLNNPSIRQPAVLPQRPVAPAPVPVPVATKTAYTPPQTAAGNVNVVKPKTTVIPPPAVPNSVGNVPPAKKEKKIADGSQAAPLAPPQPRNPSVGKKGGN